MRRQKQTNDVINWKGEDRKMKEIGLVLINKKMYERINKRSYNMLSRHYRILKLQKYNYQLFSDGDFDKLIKREIGR